MEGRGEFCGKPGLQVEVRFGAAGDFGSVGDDVVVLFFDETEDGFPAEREEFDDGTDLGIDEGPEFATLLEEWASVFDEVFFEVEEALVGFSIFADGSREVVFGELELPECAGGDVDSVSVGEVAGDILPEIGKLECSAGGVAVLEHFAEGGI